MSGSYLFSDEESDRLCETIVSATIKIRWMARWDSDKDKALDLKKARCEELIKMNIQLITHHRSQMTNPLDIARANWTINNLNAQL